MSEMTLQDTPTAIATASGSEPLLISTGAVLLPLLGAKVRPLGACVGTGVWGSAGSI